MTPREIKMFLAREGLTVANIARDLGTRRDMVSQLFNALRYYPALAQTIQRKYGIVVHRPTPAKPNGRAVSKKKKRAATRAA